MRKILNFISVITIIFTLSSCNKTKSSSSKEIIKDYVVVSPDETESNEEIIDYLIVSPEETKPNINNASKDDDHQDIPFFSTESTTKLITSSITESNTESITSSITESNTELITNSTTETSTEIESTTDNASKNDDDKDIPCISPTKLPDDIADDKENVKEDDFVYSDYLDNQYDSLILIALDDKCAYFEKRVHDLTNHTDLVFYKYDLATGETTEFNGVVPEFNVKTGDTAFVDGKIYSVMYNGTGIVHYSVDTRTNSAEIIQKNDHNDDSLMRTTHSVGEDSYMERWATGEGYNQTIHVMLFDKSGSREIITKKYDSNKARFVYTSGGDHIYEYAQTSDKPDSYLNIYNKDGKLESTKYLKEITAELGSDSGYYVWKLNVSGRFLSFEMDCAEDYGTRTYIYDMETGNFYRMDNCLSINTPNYLPSDFGKTLFLLRNDDSEGTKFDLYCLYENGDILKLSEDIGIDTMIVTNGEKGAYFKDQELYTIEY